MLSTGSKREFTKMRHAQRRDLVRACQAAVKGSSWRSNKGTLFAHRSRWLVGVTEMTNVTCEQTKARIAVKPMANDPIYWDIIGHPELRDESLSFRLFGWMTTSSLILEEPVISERGGTSAIAKRMLDIGDCKLSEIASDWTAEEFLAGLGDPISPDKKFITRVVTLLAERRYDDALQLCEASAARGESGGFVSSIKGTFNEMTAHWIEAHRTVDNLGIRG